MCVAPSFLLVFAKKCSAPVIVVDFVGYASAVVATETPAVASPSHKEEQKNHPHKPTSLAAKAAVVAVHSEKQVRIETALLHQRSKKRHHSIVAVLAENISF